MPQSGNGAYAKGCPSKDRFVENGNGMVTDNCMGLMWQKDTADVSGVERSAVATCRLGATH